MKKVILAVALIAVFILIQNLVAGTYSTYPPRGTIKGSYIVWSNTSGVDIKTGYGECNGKYWEITSDLDFNFPAMDHDDGPCFYLYIDDSAATYPVLNNTSFTSSNTAPSWSSSKMGWYNGDDRCVATVYVNDSDDIAEFKVRNENEYFFEEFRHIGLIYDASPSGSWDETSTLTNGNDADDETPVNCSALYIFMYGGHDGTDGMAWARAVANTNSRVGAYGDGYCQTGESYPMGDVGWIETGTADRSIEVFGESDDENKLLCQILGYKIER